MSRPRAAYPYDRPMGDSKKVLELCFELSWELMHMYEPFGQAGSTYHDTGYPEMVAMGIRTFLSVPENLGFLRLIGDNALDALTVMGQVAESEKIYKWWNASEKEKEERYQKWRNLIDDLKEVSERSYDAVMRVVQKYLDEFKAKENEPCEKCGQKKKNCICREIETEQTKVMEERLKAMEHDSGVEAEAKERVLAKRVLAVQTEEEGLPEEEEDADGSEEE